MEELIQFNKKPALSDKPRNFMVEVFWSTTACVSADWVYMRQSAHSLSGVSGL